MNEYVLMTYYIKYLTEIRKVSPTTVKHYQGALKHISEYLAQKGKLQKTIYEVQDIGELEIIRTYLTADPDFVALDKRGHQMYSSGFNNYYRFASGVDFSNIHDQIRVMDTEVAVPEKQVNETQTWKRSSIIKLQSIESAGYQCEVNPQHTTFTAKSTGHPYMEGHHVLPMSVQDKFNKSLDVYANIVCLCPVCHRFLHYGIDPERETVMNKIYFDRADRLAVSGIKIGKSDFERLVV